MKVLGQTIKLYNRYGDDVKLERIGKSKYILYAPDLLMRVIFEEDKTIYAIDPSGGPFMCVGSCIDEHLYRGKKTYKYITKIEYDNKINKYILTTRGKKYFKKDADTKQ